MDPTDMAKTKIWIATQCYPKESQNNGRLFCTMANTRWKSKSFKHLEISQIIFHLNKFGELLGIKCLLSTWMCVFIFIFLFK